MKPSQDAPELANAELHRAAAHLAPGHLLRQAKRLADEAEKLVELAVVAERLKETSWETIGETLNGVSKSAAQKRFGPRVTKWAAEERTGAGPAHREYWIPSAILRVQAINQLIDSWRNVGKIVEDQDLIAELTNATTAVSGAPLNDDRGVLTFVRIDEEDADAHRLPRQQTSLEFTDRAPDKWRSPRRERFGDRAGAYTWLRAQTALDEVWDSPRPKEEPDDVEEASASNRSLEERVSRLETLLLRVIEDLSRRETRL